MSATEQCRLAEMQDEALCWRGDFVSTWVRFHLTLSMMEDALRADNDLVDEFLLNAFWLRHVAESDAKEARQRLEAVGYNCGSKV